MAVETVMVAEMKEIKVEHLVLVMKVVLEEPSLLSAHASSVSYQDLEHHSSMKTKHMLKHHN